MTIHTMLGRIKVFIILTAVIRPPIHSMVVVTSPIGDHAPPALAAITTMPAKNKRIFLLGTSFRSRETITIEVVRLSNNADRKNVTQQTTHIRVFGFLVVIRSVINRNPWNASTSSTMVIAPKRKNKMPEISPKCSAS